MFSWLDILVLSAVAPVSFVAKREVASWPFVNWLARLQRTVFVDRGKRGEVVGATDEIMNRLRAGDNIVLFAEGTSSDGNQVLPFKTSLFAAAKPSSRAKQRAESGVFVQTVALAYVRQHGLPLGRLARPHIAWYGDMELASHVWAVLKRGPLDVCLRIGEPVRLDVFSDRKALARYAETQVRAESGRPADAAFLAIRVGKAGRQAPIGTKSGAYPAARAIAARRGQDDMTGAAKKLFIKTFGCQMNVYDTERMAEAMAPVGYVCAAQAEDADLIILNTCHIREKAAEKVYSELGRLRQIKEARKREGRKTVICVAGCVAQAEGREIIARAPVVDLVVGPQSYHRLPEMVVRASQEGSRLIDTEFPEDDKFSELPARTGTRRAPSAFLTVQEGCDKFCTFCVVPYTRGAEYSRPVAEIVDEAARLADAGVREITLLGQNVNAYHGEGPGADSWSLARLLTRLAEIDGLERLRYTTSHPRDMSDDLIAVHGQEPKLMPYLHLPFQAGSDRILAGMNRKHTAEDYLRLVERIRAARPDIALSTDIIVGFPGETEEEFEATLDVVREVNFAQAYSFKYSARPGTPAASLEEQLPDGLMAERLQRLQNLLKHQQIAFNKACIGTRLPVLFDRQGRRQGQLVGRSPYLQAVHASGEAANLGRIIEVEIIGAGPNSLEADTVSASHLPLETAAAL